MGETPYVETEALIRVMRAVDLAGNDERPNYVEARDLLRDMLPSELKKLTVYCAQLSDLACEIYEEEVYGRDTPHTK